ncbi:MAG TPA: bifunctional UDP-N-acetylglucosamine diphosphorylase/glucosamine-1-phosphate N-acetyltransferase GlmU [Bryobacteraceae bacterium]|nr:UDP-N-acetylglucosamine diphosphorylase/glucosamine-1-phosphate N-acetyltransferase [Bryobacterales bacterium]HRJ18326.1 bifunctional UDP-N-acetylglucosamine diphosphorylase/glucosamine-1-phosphate N-acetyltransferase GlmU [Bryobacteraceae bacterium]
MSIPVSAIILAAGLGTRMRSKMAKVLHRAGGGHLLEHVIAAGRAVAPADRITAVIGHQAERVRAAVEHHGVSFATQKEQLGTGDAVNACRDLAQHAEGRIIVLYGDCPLLRGETIAGLLAHHIEQGCAATLITTHLDDPTGYGRIYRDDAGRVVKIVEEKACLPEEKLLKEINSGIYCFEAAALWPALAELRPNPASGEYYLTDIPEILARTGLKTAAYVVDDPHEILGINTRLELADVDRILRGRRTRELMIAGVTIEQPETVRIDTGVEVGIDTVIGPFAQLRGRTRVGEGCTIGACSIVEDSELGDGSVVEAFTVVTASRVGEGAQVGPFARLRMGAQVEEGAHAGNFVELKKTKLGAGSKAMHLAYLGDATIGENANIGAGTITCNYDGKKKHPTVIGDGAFVGSNSTLVAPVEIGEGSYVAAGSVITKPVPADALGIGRGHQAVKEGWAKQRREK